MLIDPTPVLRLIARPRVRALQALDPARVQRAQLQDLVLTGRTTAFGRDHRLDQVETLADFRAAVPLSTYETLWERYWRDHYPLIQDQTWPGRIPYFAVSSGTSSGRTKYIPVTHAMVSSNRETALDLLKCHVVANPRSRVLDGLNFMLGGSIDMEKMAEGVFNADLSGIARAEAPRWSEPFLFPPRHAALESNWERKIDQLAQLAIDKPIRMIAGTPSWLLLFFERVAALGKRGDRLARYFPGLDLIVQGGMSFAPYRDVFARWLEGSRASLREVYPASEGFIAFQDATPEDGLRMNLDRGIFYEFLPLEQLDHPAPDLLWAGDVQPGRDYSLVMTTKAGLWRYQIGDVVRMVSRDPLRIVVTGRTSYMLSAFGEHVTGEELETAVLAAATADGLEITEFSVGPLFPGEGRATGQHLFVIEPRSPAPPGTAARWAQVIDQRLCELNDDYRIHRTGDYQLRPPQLMLVPPGTFNDWMRQRGKLGGQNKVPRVISQQPLLDSLRAHAAGQTLLDQHSP